MNPNQFSEWHINNGMCEEGRQYRYVYDEVGKYQYGLLLQIDTSSVSFRVLSKIPLSLPML